MNNLVDVKKREKQFDAYISYSNKDAAFVKKLSNDLSDNGIQIFIDYEQLAPGEIIVNEIENGILNSKLLIVVLSPDYMQSNWTEFERVSFKSSNLAKAYERIIAVVCSQIETHLQTSYLDYIDFTSDYDSGLKTLLGTLLKALSKENVELSINDSDQTHQKLRVFLCHSSYDKLAARNAYNRLSSEGFEVWFEEDKVIPGQDWDKLIVDAIRNSDVVVIFLSNKAINTYGYFHKEIRHVLNEYEEREILGKIFIMPVRLDECDVPLALRKVQYVDLFDERSWSILIYSLRHREAEIQKGIGVRPETLRALRNQLPAENLNNPIHGEEKQRSKAVQNNLSFWDKVLVAFNTRKQISDFSIKVAEILSNLLRPGANDVEKIAATQIQLLTSYYSLVLSQAQRSFNWALIWATIGVLGFVVAGVFLFTSSSNDVALIGTIGSSLVEVISGINFYLYNKASLQLAEFHTRLNTTQQLLLSNAVAEKIEGELKQITRSHIALKFAGIDVKPEVVNESLDLTPQVCITHIELNPAGSDVAKEFVTIENSGKVVADMTNWSLSDEAGHTFKFPMFFLKPGASVNIWTRAGKNIPTDLYWKMKRAIWNNNEDVACLRNSNGGLVDTFRYSSINRSKSK